VELQMIKKPTRCAKLRKSFGVVCRQDLEFVRGEAFANNVNDEDLAKAFKQALKSSKAYE
jgi:hypothetical protein